MDSGLLSEGALAERIRQLAQCGVDGPGGVTRLVYTPAWQAAQTLVAQWMAAAGLAVRIDAVGNVFGRLAGKSERVILTGSHLDTVAGGGAYDGAYGIIAGIAAVGGLAARGVVPERSLEVVALCEEEGSRFFTTCWGSRAVTGLVGADEAYRVTDRHQAVLADAMREAGLAPDRVAAARRTDVDAFVELHVEQGPVLDREGADIGVVSAICGQERLIVRVEGEGNHAGTTPMAGRRDAMAAAAEMILAVEAGARELGGGAVATVGSLDVPHGMSNVVPGRVVFSVDLRAPTSEHKHRLSKAIQDELAAVARRRGLNVEWERYVDVAAVPMDGGLRQVIADAAAGRGYARRDIDSGAGHDAQIFGSVIPSAMIFIPSRMGISHHYLEYSAPEHLLKGALCLQDVLVGAAAPGMLAARGGQAGTAGC